MLEHVPDKGGLSYMKMVYEKGPQLQADTLDRSLVSVLVRFHSKLQGASNYYFSESNFFWGFAVTGKLPIERFIYVPKSWKTKISMCDFGAVRLLLECSYRSDFCFPPKYIIRTMFFVGELVVSDHTILPKNQIEKIEGSRKSQSRAITAEDDAGQVLTRSVARE